METKTMTAESFVETIDLTNFHDEEREECVCLTLWLPIKYKVRYDQMQNLSKRKFGKLLKTVVMKTIDRAKIA